MGGREGGMGGREGGREGERERNKAISLLISPVVCAIHTCLLDPGLEQLVVHGDWEVLAITTIPVEDSLCFRCLDNKTTQHSHSE